MVHANEHGDIKSAVDELRSIKQLLILQSLALGCQQKHVASALGVSEATLSRMFPKGFAKQMARVAGRAADTSEKHDD